MNKDGAGEFNRIAAQYRFLAILMYGKYYARRDMPTSELLSSKNGLPLLRDLVDDGYVKVVRKTSCGTWYNITPEGERLYAEYVSLIEEVAISKILLKTKGEVKALIEKNRSNAKESAKMVNKIQKEREVNV